jgi:hypothetical protein
MTISRWLAAIRAVRGGALAAMLGGVVGCSSPGPFGFAQLYTPLDIEHDATDGSVPFDPSAVRRKPDAWKNRLVVAFGVVEDVGTSDTPESTRVLLSVRGLQPRNLCDGPDDQTCRVTVTDTEFAKLWAQIPNASLVPKRTPPDPVQPGSLLRVVGKLAPASNDVDPPLVNASFARHWPLQMYVTTSARESMRR